MKEEDKKKPKIKATENTAKDVETKTKERRKNLAAELGELTLYRAKLADQLNQVAKKCNQIATQMESLPK